MANKRALLGGATIKVENMSGFDKSRFNAFTAPLGAIVPMAKQLMIPGKFRLALNVSAQLPPLATDAFLRTHLKVEAFLIPLRLCYGGFQSFFGNEPISTDVLHPGSNSTLSRAKMPYLGVYIAAQASRSQVLLDEIFGPHSLMDYFGVKMPLDSTGHVSAPATESTEKFNLLPFVAYQLVYHHWYRNKLIQRPLFAPIAHESARADYYMASALPYEFYRATSPISVTTSSNSVNTDADYGVRIAYKNASLLNGHLLQLRYRNYGLDYFTSATPSAQDGNPMTVDTSNGNFSISALRLSNSLQHYAEVNQLAGPDYVSMNKARYGVDLSSGVAQKPILCGSADFPMFSSGVEQQAQSSGANPTQNPFAGIGARYGRAHAEGHDFVCDVDVKEPSYLLVNFSLVPEANYATGIAHDMRIFTEEGSIVDLPCAMLENTGWEPIYEEEIHGTFAHALQQHIFSYQPRYMWHKAGAVNEVHGLFRQGCSLASFIPQRTFGAGIQLSDGFLSVRPTDLDNVMAVSGALSQFGVMVDSAIDLKVVEPLSESVLPSLSDPSEEHGHDVYLTRGGSHI